MPDQRDLPLFDSEMGAAARDEGISRATDPAKRKLHLLDAKRVAILLALRKGEVTADDVVEYYAERGINLHDLLGNAMGDLFRDRDVWEFTGKWVLSKQVQRHRNAIRVWRLK